MRKIIHLFLLCTVLLPVMGCTGNKDADAPAQLLDLAIKTVNDEQKLASLRTNILKLALPNSADIIADEVIKLTGYSGKSNA